MTRNQMLRKVELVLLILLLLSFCLPWFTFDFRLTGAYWGLTVLRMGGLFFVYDAVYLLKGFRNPWAKLLMALSLLGLMGLQAWAFYSWAEVRNISGDFSWQVSCAAAQPGFWLSCILSCLAMLAFLLQLGLRDGREELSHAKSE